VHTIVRMATNLGLTVVAEGIETAEQMRLLQGMSCGSGQGYLFDRPAELSIVARSPEELREPATALVGDSGTSEY